MYKRIFVLIFAFFNRYNEQPYNEIIEIDKEKDNLDYVNAMQLDWQKSVREELLSYAAEQKLPLASIKDGDNKELNPTTEEQAYLFDTDDILNQIKLIVPPNLKVNKSSPSDSWGLVKSCIKTPTYEELLDRFKDLLPVYRQTGLDDTYKDEQWFSIRRQHLGNSLLEIEYKKINIK